MREDKAMKITNDPTRITPPAAQRPLPAVGQAHKADTQAAASPASQPAATVQFSSRAMELHAAMEAARDVPDVREDKVADARQRISNGTYKVDAEQIARRMLDRLA